MDERQDVRLLKPAQDIWLAAQDVLLKKLSEPSFKMWIKPMKMLSIEGGVASFAVYNDFMRGIINGKFKDPIIAALSEIIKEPVTIDVTIDPSIRADEYTPTIASISILPSDPKAETSASTNGGTRTGSASQSVSQTTSTKPGLNTKYTFSTFVVGSHNRFCHSAANAVADRPGQAYNPLFLYGGVGLGKTHIMQAIGHEIMTNSPNLSVRYITCERFTNE